MKKFIVNLFVFFTLLCIAVVGVAILSPHNKSAYLYAQKIKMNRLDTLASPRLILVGGSNVAFGIDSRMLGDSLGLNVVNAGLFAGFGFRFMLEEVSERLACGDIVVLMPEYSQFTEDFFYGEAEGLASGVMYGGIGSLRHLNLRQLKLFAMGLSRYINVNSRPVIDDPRIYNARNFNEFGDESAHWDLESVPSDAIAVDYDAINGTVTDEVCDEIAAYIMNMRAVGCRVFLLPQISIQKNYVCNKSVIECFYAKMAARGIPFCLDAEELVVPDSLAYDSSNHVNRTGVTVSTLRLVGFLKRVL